MVVTETSASHDDQAEIVNLDATTYPSEDALSQDVIKGLETDGCCIIRGVFEKKVVNDISHEVRPYLSDRGVTISTFSFFSQLLSNCVLTHKQSRLPKEYHHCDRTGE